jgi:arsenate reductase
VAPLQERGVDVERVDCLQAPVGAATLRALLDAAGLRPREVVRLKEAGARELPLDDHEATLRALVERPELLQRPLAQSGERVLPARPPERVLELLD